MFLSYGPLLKRRASVAAFMIVTAALAQPISSLAQSYPSKPVRLVVAFAPGGPNDVMARLLAQRLSINTGAQFVVDNKPGAGGIIGTEAVATAAPDGYTLLFASAPFTMSPAIQPKMPFDTAKDFAGVSKVAQSPMVLTTPPNSPYKSLKQLIEAARANPGKLTYGTGGVGSTPHLTTEQFAMEAGIKLLHVPYKGGGQSIQAVMAGEIDMLLDSITSSVGLIAGNKVNAIAIGRPSRWSKFPNIPTFAEAGSPNFTVTHWVGVVAPAKTPAPIVAKLQEEIVKALKYEDVKKAFGEIGAEPVGDSPAEFQAFINAELQRWKHVAKTAHVTAQ